MKNAFKIAESIRYSDDKHEDVLAQQKDLNMRVSAYHNFGFKVSPEMTPKIYDNLEKLIKDNTNNVFVINIAAHLIQSINDQIKFIKYS